MRLVRGALCALFVMLAPTVLSTPSGGPAGASAGSQPSRALWTTIPFVRGQDLCQYEDAYGRSRSALRADLTRDVQALVMMGATPMDAAAAVTALDRLIDRQRRLATAGMGMDVLLEGTVKAQIDRIYDTIRPQSRALRFHNPSTLISLLEDVREQRRQGRLSPEQTSRIDGLMWGTYSYAPSCRGELIVTLHVEMRDGTTQSFGCRGRPEHVANQLASQVFQHFQRTRLPAAVNVEGRRITLLGAAPGRRDAQAPSLASANAACRSQDARLPTLAEYQQIGLLGDWNGGISLGEEAWWLPDGRAYVPAMPRPTPVRDISEVIGDDLHFFCVR